MGLIQYYQITCQPVNQAICIFIILPIVFCNHVSIKYIIIIKPLTHIISHADTLPTINIKTLQCFLFFFQLHLLILLIILLLLSLNHEDNTHYTACCELVTSILLLYSSTSSSRLSAVCRECSFSRLLNFSNFDTTWTTKHKAMCIHLRNKTQNIDVFT